MTVNNKGSIRDALYWLMRNERFYGYLINNMVVNYTERVPIAGVNILKGKINLYINREAWAENDLPTQIEVLKHEILHIVKGHIDRAVKLEKNFDQGSNIAADCAINQLIKMNGDTKVKFVHTDTETGEKITNESTGVHLETFKEAIKAASERTGAEVDVDGIEAKQSMDYYLTLVREQQKNGAGMQYDSFDDHEIWQKSDATAEEMKQIKKQAFKDAMSKLSDKEIGELPGDLVKDIGDLLKVQTNWKSILNRHLGNAVEFLKEETRKKRNRRYGLKYPGIKKEPKLNLVIGLDTSGSINFEAAQMMFSHVKKILDTFNEKITVTVVECDTVINRTYSLTKVPKNPSLSGGGGTYYKPFFDYAKENKADMLLIFGDGYCFDNDKLKKPKYPVIWAIDETGQFPVDWGKKVEIPLTNMKQK